LISSDFILTLLVAHYRFQYTVCFPLVFSSPAPEREWSEISASGHAVILFWSSGAANFSWLVALTNSFFPVFQFSS